MRRGDIVWVELPSRGGHEQAGRRPAIVWQSEAACEALSTVVLIPLTSQISALRFPGTTLIERSDENGLRQNSVALVFQLTAADKNRLRGEIGSLSESDSERIEIAWAELTEDPESVQDAVA